MFKTCDHVSESSAAPQHDAPGSSRSVALRAVLLLLKLAAVGACFYYVGFVLYSNMSDLRAAEFTLRWLPLFGSLPLAFAYLLGRGLIWHLIVRRVIGRFPWRTDVLSWMSSLVGKYIPGKVFLLFGRVYFYRQSGARASAVSLCFLIEACCSALATLLVFAAGVLTRRGEALGNLKYLLVILAVALVVATHPAVLRFGLNTAMRLTQRETFAFHLRWRDILGWTLLISANWMILGLGFWLLLRAVFDVPFDLYPYVTGAFAVAGIIGIMALFAPSGLGVRESVMTLVLAIVMPSGVAAVAALLARVWMTLAEAICLGIAMLRVRKMKTQVNPHVGVGLHDA